MNGYSLHEQFNEQGGNIREREQLKRSPGKPLIVNALDTFGAPPLASAWVSTSTTLASYQSPTFK